jgi:hypothetical protein
MFHPHSPGGFQTAPLPTRVARPVLGPSAQLRSAGAKGRKATCKAECPENEMSSYVKPRELRMLTELLSVFRNRITPRGITCSDKEKLEPIS